MTERISGAQRARLQNVAEHEVMRFAGDHAAWHKHIHNVELDPIQILKCQEMDEHPFTVDFASRRTGKTAIKELYELHKNATTSDQELGIVAPREAQAQVNLDYHLDAIRRSEILTSYLNHKSGRRQLADTYYQFANRSLARCYGIMAQVDGGDLTSASLEEVDDMPKERLFSRFLLMMGSKRRLGASTESENDAQIRITGVYKGADTLTDLLDSGEYHAIGCFHGERAKAEIRGMIAAGHLDGSQIDVDQYEYPVPIGNALVAMQMGLINADFMGSMRRQLSPDEYARQLLCVNTSSRNLIWEKWLRLAIQRGLVARLEMAPPEPAGTYRKRGLVAMGYDASGHGEDPRASKHALVIVEEIAGYLFFPWVRLWPAGTDEATVKRDLRSYWAYYRPDIAMGDAYAVGMLTQLCDELYAEGLTDIDRRTVSGGDSTASSWPEWPFSPLRFEGMVKHSMAVSLAAAFYNKQAVLPYIEDSEGDPECADMHAFQQQLTNVRAVATSKTYASYKMVRRDIGDDLFDAAMAAVWGLVTRGAMASPTAIITRGQTQSQLLGESPVRLPSDPIGGAA